MSAPTLRPATLIAESLDDSFRVCEDFRNSWKSGKKPHIPDFLEKVGEQSRTTLLRNLIEIDIACSRSTGVETTVDHYLKLFPGFANVVREVFINRSISSLSALTTTEDPITSFAKPQTSIPLTLGNYKIIRELGRGAMGVVYEAVALQGGNHVALKMLPRVEGELLLRFKQEFRSMAEINHPNLACLHSLETDGGFWFFTMDLIENGKDFISHVRPNGQLNEKVLRSAMAQLVLGVLGLHRNHVVHCDLKPSNVMVTADGRVLLLDFGLVARLRGGSAGGEGVVAGTPRYMAPEQTVGTTLTPMADWYSVGVMLYEALSGDVPFTGSILEIMGKKKKEDAPPLKVGPPDLRELAMKLLSRDPAMRPDPLEITKILVPKDTSSHEYSGASTNHSLVGRGEQLDAFEKVYSNWKVTQRPHVIFVSGRSGEGKSTLVDHFLKTKEKENLLVLQGRCYDRESVPFKALDSLIDYLGNYLKGLPKAELDPLLPEDMEVLAKVFPVLKTLIPLDNNSEQFHDERQIRHRAFSALRELLTSIGKRRPIVLFIDDLQWGDSDSALVLLEVLRNSNAPLLFVGTFREESKKSPFLSVWDDTTQREKIQLAVQNVRVKPLSEEDCVKLVLRTLEKDNDKIRARAVQFASQTGGNPLLLTELVGNFDPESDSFESLDMSQMIEKKLGRLHGEARRLLEIIAISGQAISIDEISLAAGHDSNRISTVTKMRSERLVRIVGSETDKPLIDTYHDRIREMTVDKINPELRKELHLSLANTIEKLYGGLDNDFISSMENGESAGNQNEIHRVYDLSYHYDAAQEKRKAWIYSLLAAEQAKRQTSNNVASLQYSIAERNGELRSTKARYRVALGYGQTLMLLGKYDEAERQLKNAAMLTNGVVEETEVMIWQGELSFKKGEIKESMDTYERGLRLLGVWVPRTTLGFVLGVLKESAVQLVHSLFPKSLHKKKPNPRATNMIRFFARLHYPYFFQSTLKFVWTNLSGLNHSENFPDGPDTAYNYTLHGVLLAHCPWDSRLKKYLDRAIQIRKETNDQWGLGWSYCYLGMGQYTRGRFREAIKSFEECIRILAKAGDLWELNLAHYHKGCCHFEVGELKEAAAEAKVTFEQSIYVGEDSRAHCALLLMTKINQGKLAFDDLKSCFRHHPDDILSTTHLRLAQAYFYDFHQRHNEAVLQFENALKLSLSHLVINFHTVETIPALVLGLRNLSKSLWSTDRKQAKKLMRKADLYASVGAFLIGIVAPVHYPFALRELAMQLRTRGKTKKALQIAKKACVNAKKFGAHYAYAQSDYLRAQLLRELGVSGAEQKLADARNLLYSMESQVSSGASREVERKVA